MRDYHVAWWNVENLFDHARARRPAYLRAQLANELDGWTATVRDQKIAQLASVITQMNDAAGPDLLGVCEIENRNVLARLAKALDVPGRDYAIAHHDATDKRGIDVAFIYDANVVTPDDETFGYVVRRRNATRDIFQVNFNTAAGNKLIAIGNHWPSRSMGRWASEPYRIIAAETLSYWVQRIQEEYVGEDAAILVMGDFNDGPLDRSLVDYALSVRTINQVNRARSPKLLNLMFPEMGRGLGTHYYSGPAVLDQFLVSKGMVGADSALRALPETVRIMRPEEMQHGSYDAPRRFGRPSSEHLYDPDGFSDHFPIAVTIRENG